MTRLPARLLARSLAAAGLLAALAAVAGCESGGDDFAPVTGKVTLNGQVLKYGVVTFRPDATKGNPTQHHPTGEIQPDGTYTLMTAGRKGAPPGHYKVLVFVDENASAGAPAHPVMPKWAINVKYTDEATTDLRVEVVAKPVPGQYDLKVTK